MDYVDAATNQYIVTWHTPSGRPEKYALTYRIWTTFNNALTYFFGWHPSFLPVSNYTCIDNRRQFMLLINVPIQNRAQQLQIYEVFSLSVPHSNLSAQYKINHKIIGVIIWWNKGSCYHRSAVQSLPPCKWTVLQNKCTIPTLHKPTII